MTNWQAHWTSSADTGNGPLRASGYGDSPEEAHACLIRHIEGMILQWQKDATSFSWAIDEALAMIENA